MRVAEGVARLADLDGLKDAGVAQLLQTERALELVGYLLHVGLDRSTHDTRRTRHA